MSLKSRESRTQFAMMLACAVAGGGLASGRAAAAQELVAIHPGLMCRSGSALARLTLDDGSARTAGRHGTADDVLKDSGGCIDFAVGARVTADKVKVGTSEVTCEVAGVKQTFVIANQDFMPARDDALADGGAASGASGHAAAAAASGAALADDGRDASAADNEAAHAANSDGAEADVTPAPAADAAAVASAAPTAPGSRSDLAVTGLELGMTEDDAHLKLGAAYEFEPQQALGDADVDRVTAVGRDPNNSYRLGFVDQQLWFVNHMVVFAAGRQPDLQHLVARLKAKYGQPTRDQSSSTDGYRAWWQYDANQRPLSTAVERCLADGAPFAGRTLKGGEQEPAFQGRFADGCPPVISVLILPNPKATERVERLQVIMAQPKAMYDHLRQMDGALAQKKAAESEQLNKAAAM